jgi:hypothetical protein
MVKPRLPDFIENQLPLDIIWYISTFVPHMEKRQTPSSSPSLQKELTRIQNINLKGKNANYMMDLEDFILDDERYY